MKKKSFKEKRGAFSLLMVTLILIISTLFMGYIDIGRKTFSLNEIQQRMDRAGLNALEKSIDKSLLKEEIFGLDSENYSDKQLDRYVVRNYENKIISAYTRELSQTINSDSVGLIGDFKIHQASVSFDVNNWGVGQSTQRHPQITLHSIAVAKVKVSNKLDVLSANEQQFYDSKSGNTFSVSVTGRTNDGYSEIMIRSAVRVVYR